MNKVFTLLGLMGWALMACSGSDSPSTGRDSTGRPASPVVPIVDEQRSPTTQPAVEKTADLALGEDLTPDLTALSDNRTEANSIYPYTETYGARISPLISGVEPGLEASGTYCLRIQSDGPKRSGIRQKSDHFTTDPDQRYLIRARIFCSIGGIQFRLAVKTDDRNEPIWGKDIQTGSINFVNTAGAWDEFGGLLEIPVDQAGPTELWIITADSKELTWFLDDVSVQPIFADPVEPAK